LRSQGGEEKLYALAKKKGDKKDGQDHHIAKNEKGKEYTGEISTTQLREGDIKFGKKKKVGIDTLLSVGWGGGKGPSCKKGSTVRCVPKKTRGGQEGREVSRGFYRGKRKIFSPNRKGRRSRLRLR